MQLFYIPEISNGQDFLDKDESRHAFKVLRKKAGDRVHAIDGKGNLYTIEFTLLTDKKANFIIVNQEGEYQKRNHYLHILVAPTKNIDRIEWFLEKATEIGIDRITPILCEHSERNQIKEDRLNRIIVSAMKQSEKAYLPTLDPLTKIEDAITESFEGQRFIAYCEDKPEAHLHSKLDPSQKQVQVFIGPEGDFSPKEIELAQQNHIDWVNLGQSRLRTETAALVACHTVNLFHE